MNLALLGLTPGRQPSRQPWSLERLIQERATNLSLALETGTTQNYHSATRSWISFIEMHNFPLEPSADTLSFYISYMSTHVKVETIEGYLSGLASVLEPFFPDVRQHRKLPLVKQTLKGCHKRYTTPTQRKRPLTKSDLAQVKSQLNLVDYDNFLFFTLLTVGFHNLHRLGELVWPDDHRLQSVRKVIQRSTLVDDGDFMTYELPYHKADNLYQGSLCMLTTSGTEICPVATLRDYLLFRDLFYPNQQHLFVREDGSIPKRSWFISKLRLFFDSEVSGHSLRAGGATALALEGAPDAIIQRMGRWSSSAFQIYIRVHPLLTHLALANLRS